MAVGLVAAYSFDDRSSSSVLDISGQGNDGEIVNANRTFLGKYGSSMFFNGKDAQITVPDSASLKLSSGMTLEAWVLPTTVNSAWQDVIYKGSNGNNSYYLQATTSSNAKPMGGATVGGSARNAYGAKPISLYSWSHLAVTFDGAATRFYVNGAQVATTAGSGTIKATDGALQIGGDSYWGRYFNGLIDEVRIYDTALTQSQIKKDMATPIGKTPPILTDQTAPTVTSRTPGTGSSGVAAGSKVSATFSEAVQAGTISFALKSASGATVAATVAYDAASRTATLTPSSALSGSTTYTATLSGAKDAAGNLMAATSWSFTTAAVDKTAPTVTSRTPGTGSSGVAAGSKVSATFSEAVQAGTISFALKSASGATVAATVAYDAASRTATLTPSSALSGSTTYTATLSGAKDAAGNLMAATSWSFTTAAVDKTAPTVTSRTPGTGSSGVAAGSKVSATFSEAVQAGTISFALKSASGATVAATVAYDAASRTATLTPSSALSGSTTYTATLSGAKDAAGNLMAATSWSFTTATILTDQTAPTVTSRTPGTGSSGVAAGSKVSATFSEAVQAGTISFALKSASGATVAATVAYDAASRTATLTPSSALSGSTTYTATLSGAKDAAGNLMAATSWSFTTAAVVAPTPSTGKSITFQDYDGLTSAPLNPLGGGRLYPEQGAPNSSGEGGYGTLSINSSDSVSGSSLLNHMTSGRLYLAWWNNDGGQWNFARETKSDKAAWEFNTYNRMVMWVKMPELSQEYLTNGNMNVELGTYTKRITNEDPYSQETGGGHFYHQLNIPSLGAWTQVVINMYPDHSRGVSGDPGSQQYPTVKGGDPANTYNYFDTLTSFYLDMPYADPKRLPADYLVDNIEFMTVPYQENDQQVKSLTGTYVPGSNRVVVTWNNGWGDASIHEVRYSFSDIHKSGWDAATPAPGGSIPRNYSEYAGRVFDSSALPLAGHSMVYIAIKPQNSDLFTQIAIPISSFGKASTASIAGLMDGTSNLSTLSGSTSAQQDATVQQPIMAFTNADLASNAGDSGGTAFASSAATITTKTSAIPRGPAQSGRFVRQAVNQEVSQESSITPRRLINDQTGATSSSTIRS
ncbi:Copper resistance protein CopC [Planctomyces sp. SH-PL62]|nr:Copper resistance protein CopC [Planctomyces sp. SH-PL62]